jgi:ABC-type phosphate transport system substrate-binding protein
MPNARRALAMTSRVRTFASFAALCACPVVAAAQAVDLTGAGATFPFPAYSKVVAEYSRVVHVAARLSGSDRSAQGQEARGLHALGAGVRPEVARRARLCPAAENDRPISSSSGST